MNVKPTTSDPGGTHDPQPGQTPGAFRRVWLGVRDRVLGSLLVVTPVLITLWVIRWLYPVLDRQGIDPRARLVPWKIWGYRPDAELPGWFETYAAPLIAAAALLLLLYGLGFFGRSRLGGLVDRAFLRVPLVSGVYNGVRQVIHTLDRQRGQIRSRRVVLIAFPHPGLRVPARSVGVVRNPRCHCRAAPVAGWVLVLSAGCSSPAQPPEAVRPVKTVVIAAGEEPHVRTFPGKVEASKKAELAFQVSGLLVSLPVKEGQPVKTGEVIAQLRRDEFEARLKTLRAQLDQARAALRAVQAGERGEERHRREAAVRAAEARLANARIELDRNTQLVRRGAGAQADLDAAAKAYRVAQADLAAAQQVLEKGMIGRVEEIEAQEAAVRALEARVVEANLQLEDSTLRAPFDGVVAKRFVEPNQNVAAKQPVVRFQDADEIEIGVDVPETVMAASLRLADIVSLVAEISGAPGLRFPVQIREVAQVADPVTQTFKVRVAMKAPTEARILPGMTAVVTLTYRRASILGNRILVPIEAVFQRPAGEQVAWVVGPDDTVSPHPVELGAATGGRVEVVAGLRPGDRIVVAGVRFLREGKRVRDLGDALGGGPP